MAFVNTGNVEKVAQLALGTPVWTQFTLLTWFETLDTHTVLIYSCCWTPNQTRIIVQHKGNKASRTRCTSHHTGLTWWLTNLA